MNNPYTDPYRKTAAAAMQALSPDPAPEKIPGRALAVVIPADTEDEEIQPPYFVAFGDVHTREIDSLCDFDTLEQARAYVEEAFAGDYAAVHDSLRDDHEFSTEEAWPFITHALISDELSEDVELLCRVELTEGAAA